MSLLKEIYKQINRKINPYVKNPLTRNFGFRRGTSIDRYIINKKINIYLNNLNIKKHLKGLEIGGFDYLDKQSNKYQAYELVPFSKKISNDKTIVHDLNKPLKKDFKYFNQFDFVICTQVLAFVEDDINALKVIHSMMKKNSILLGAVPGIISTISSYDYKRWGHFRGYSDQGIRNLLERNKFQSKIETYGNFELAYEFINGSCINDIDSDLINNKDYLFQILQTFEGYPQK